MLKKVFLFLFLHCFPLVYSQQITEQNVFDQLTSETIKTIVQIIEKLSPKEKLVLQENFFKNVEQLTNKEKVSAHLEWIYPVYATFMVAFCIAQSCVSVCMACSAVCTCCALASITCGSAGALAAGIAYMMQRKRNKISVV